MNIKRVQFGSNFYFLFIVIILTLTNISSSCPLTVQNENQLLEQSPDCFKILYDFRQHDGNILSKIINDRLETYKRLLQVIKMKNIDHIQTTPVVKWAQSQTQIYLGLKLSHRQDSPTCSDIREQSFSIKNIQKVDAGDLTIHPFDDTQYSSDLSSNSENYNQSTVHFRSECFFTHQKFLFTLTFQFEQLISNLTILREGLGSYTLIASKFQKGIWLKPFTNSNKAAIWPELRNKFQKDMDHYFSMAQQAFSTTSKGKKKRNRKNAQIISPEIQTEINNNQQKQL